MGSKRKALFVSLFMDVSWNHTMTCCYDQQYRHANRLYLQINKQLSLILTGSWPGPVPFGFKTILRMVGVHKVQTFVKF